MDYMFDDSDYHDYVARLRGPDLELLFSSDSDLDDGLNEHDNIIVISDSSDNDNEPRDYDDMETESEEAIYISSDTEEEEVLYHRPGGITYAKRKKNRRPKTPKAIACSNCDVPFRTSERSIFNRKVLSGLSFCRGCAFLRKNFKKKDYKIVVNWLLTGATSLENDFNENLNYLDETLQEFKSHVKSKTANSHDQISQRTYFYQLCIENNLRCAVTGHVLRYKKNSRHDPWSLSLDHIEPKSRRTASSKSIYNTQIMCSLLNNIKDNLDNQEILDWYDAFKKAHGY